MDLKERIGKFFHTKDGEIQRAYQAYDGASDLLNARDKDPEFSKTQELEESLKNAEERALEILERYEGQKSWPGIFREMHLNLARLWLRTGKYEEANKECEKVAEYNRIDAEILKETIVEAMAGKKFESTQLDEVDAA